MVVVGFNCSDDRAIIKDLLRECGVTFPVILDTTDAAKEVCFKHYQHPGLSAVPLNYLIDRTGKIAAGWYDPNLDRMTRELKKLGFE